MSLQVWLPLNGDLHNQGLSNINLTNTVTFATSGKIGASCLNSQLGWFAVPEMAGKKQMSFAYWVKLNAGTTTNWLDPFSWYSTNGTSDHRSRQEFYYYNSGGNTEAMTTGVWYYNNSNSGLTQRKIGQWYHYAFTIDYTTGITQFFVDGVLWKTTTNADTSHYVKGNNFLLRESSLDCSINDFRLYDHILSTKEVEEIAKGLVLHYKLDQPNRNLLTNDWDLTTWSKESGISVSWDNTVGMYKVLDSSHTSSRWGIYQNITLSANTTYTFSVDGMKKDQNVNFGFAEGTSWPANAGSFTTTMSRLSKTITVGDADANCRIYLNINPVTDGSNYGYFRAPKLEIGSVATNWNSHTENIIYDSSGYNNNGTIVGSLGTVGDSSRYSCATKFDGSSAIKVNNNNWMAQGASNLTVNIWAYMDNWSNWNGHRLYSCTEGGGFNIENTIANSLTFPVCVYTNTAHSTTGYIPAQSRAAILKTDLTSGWHMFTYIYTETECQCYLDGILYQTKPYVSYGVYFNINGSRLFLGCEANGVNASGPYFTGQESDFRLYYTALTPEQIKELYNTSMSIDNNGNIHARELVEL